MVNSSQETKARKPLAAAEVQVTEIPDNPGYYAAKFFLRPHYQLEGLTVSLRLVSILKGLKLPESLDSDEELKSFELTFLFDHSFYDLENNVSAENFQLNSVPVINLFPFKANRITVTPNLHEYHVVPDRSKPMDYEVYSVDEVTAARVGQRGGQSFKEMYRALGDNTDEQHGYFSVRRELRQMSDTALRSGLVRLIWVVRYLSAL